jgi:hypothetical protein
MNAREASILTGIREAIEDGEQDLALGLLDALDVAPKAKDVRCPHCPQTFSWPGQRDLHVGLHHGFGEAEAA